MQVIKPMKGWESKFRRLAGASSVESIWDLHAELKFALVFVGLGFEVEFEPLGDAGPDLLVSRDGQSVYVEIVRRRPPVEIEKTSAEELWGDQMALRSYGSPVNLVDGWVESNDIKKVRDEVSNKFRQLKDHKGIIAFWSDNDAVEEFDFEWATERLLSDIENGVQLIPADLLFVVFGSNAVWRQRQFYCQALCLGALPEPFSVWFNDLERCCVLNTEPAAIKHLMPLGE